MKHANLVWPASLLIAILLFNAIFTPGFMHVELRDGRLFGSLIDILNRGVPVLLLSLGMTLVIATRGVDLSVGAVMAICGAVAASLIARGLPVGGVPGIIAITLLAALLCGLFNGVLVAFFRVQPIVATLLLMVTGRGVAQLITDGQIVVFNMPSFQQLGSGSFLALPVPVWIFAGTAVLIGWLVRGTALGWLLSAMGSNPTASEYSGLNARGLILAVYAICAICAGIAGLIGTADIKAADANNAGLYLELDAILAVAIGGTSLAGGKFSITGSIIGALLMQALTTTILTKGIAPEATMVLKATIVVLVCLLQSERFGLRRKLKGAPA